MARRKFDVCVVGSGPGGGIAAYALAKAGVQVGLIESGPRLRPGLDYGAHGPWLAKLEDRLRAGKRGPIPSLFRDFGERDHFTPVGDNPAHGLLRALGGRSLCWAGHCLRFGPLDFAGWPFPYSEMAPYYDRAERFLNVHGERNGLENLPDGVFQKAVPLRCAERRLQAGVRKLQAGGREMEFVPQRKAIPTESSRRPLCHYCGHCMEGCEIDSKYTSANTPIPLALRTGNLTLLTSTMMTRILTSGGRVSAIEVEREDHDREQVECKALVLSCSAIETARHLLIHQLGNRSGQVGRNLTSHFGLTVVGYFPDLSGRDISNDDGTDYYHGLLTGLHWRKPARNFSGTYQVQCGSGVHPSRLGIRNAPGIGAAFKRELIERNACHAGMNMQGTLLASDRKFIDLDSTRQDRFGLPLPRVHLHYEDSDIQMAREAAGVCEEIIAAAGGKTIFRPPEIGSSTLVIDSNHWVGTARMGQDPRSSVVDPYGRSHDIRNLFIGDASVFPSYAEKNPTLTNIALSWRMADRLADLLKKGEV